MAFENQERKVREQKKTPATSLRGRGKMRRPLSAVTKEAGVNALEMANGPSRIAVYTDFVVSTIIDVQVFNRMGSHYKKCRMNIDSVNRFAIFVGPSQRRSSMLICSESLGRQVQESLEIDRDSTLVQVISVRIM